MKCPKCNGETEVKDSRPSRMPENYIRRRRKCFDCALRFSTKEVVVDLYIKKKPADLFKELPLHERKLVKDLIKAMSKKDVI